MRSFFKSELETLKIKTGLNQYENLSALPDAEQQFKLLFDSLEAVCNEYPYIPDNDKKRIVQEQIYRDQDFNQLTPRVVWKWLEREKHKYFKEMAHIPSESNAKPVTYEELSPEVKKGVDALLVSLQMDGNGIKSIPDVTAQELRSLEIEDEIKRGQSVHAIPSDPILVIQHKRKMDAIRSRGLDKVRDGELTRYEIEGKVILARTPEEAQEMFVEIYL